MDTQATLEEYSLPCVDPSPPTRRASCGLFCCCFNSDAALVQLCSWARGQRGQCQQRSTIYTRSCPPSYTNAQQLRLESTAGNCCLYNSLLFLAQISCRWRCHQRRIEEEGLRSGAFDSASALCLL